MGMQSLDSGVRLILHFLRQDHVNPVCDQQVCGFHRHACHLGSQFDVRGSTPAAPTPLSILLRVVCGDKKSFFLKN